MDGRFRCSRATLHFPSSHLFLSRCFIYIYIYFLSLSLPYFPRELRVAFEIEDGFNKVLEIFIDSKNFSPIKGRFIRWKCRRLILSPIYPPIEPTRLASSTRYFHDLIFYSNFWRRLLRPMPNYSTIIRLASRIISHSTRSILPSRSCQFGISIGRWIIDPRDTTRPRHTRITERSRSGLDPWPRIKNHRGTKGLCIFLSLTRATNKNTYIYLSIFFPFAEKWTPRRIFLVLNEGYRLLWIFNFSSLDNLRNNRNGKIKNRDRWVKQVGR